MSEHLALDTRTGKVKGTSSNTGTVSKPIDFNDVTVIGLPVGGSASNAFGTIVVGATSVIADAAPDTLTLVAGTNITLTPNAATDTITIAASGGGGGTGSSMSSAVTQTAHGFVVGNVLRYTGTVYSKALADTATNAEVVGLVSAVADANNFTLTIGGVVTGLSGLTAGSVYFLSTSTAGLLTTTAPSVLTQISKPLLVASSTTGGYFFNWRGWTVASAGGGGGGAVNSVFGRIGDVVALSTDYAAFYQPLDSDLTAIAALATTSFGRGSLIQADAAAFRAYIGAGTGSGSGTVTDFSAGDLAPLFTTTEANTTTTPALSFALTNAAATTVFGRAAGTSGAPTYSTSPQFLAIGNLTTNGFVKTGGGVGTLSVDTATYLTANQNISLTGDVTGGPAATSIATTIVNSVVTYAKIQNVSATSRFLGRITAAAGVVEELTAANAKTILALTSADVGLGNVTNAAQTLASVVPNTLPSAGQILIGNVGGTAYAKNSVSGSGATITLGATGVLTISAILESSLSITNVTTGDATTSAHGFAPKGTVGTTQFWRQDWTLATPGGTGTVTATGGALTANSVVLGAGTTDTKVVGGIITDGTSKLTLGVSTTSVGSIALNNLTSGSVTIQPATGALSTATMTIPAGSTNPVVADTGAANNFLTGISTAGVISKAQPTPTNVGLGNVTNAAQTLASVVPNTLPAAGQLLIGNAGATAYAPVTMGTDATITSAGALTIANNAVTLAKMATMATDSILGRATAATGNVEVLASLPFAFTGDVTRAADSNVTVLANIPDLTPAVGSILFTNIAVPTAPASTKDKVWFDTTDQRLHEKNTAGTIGTTVVADAGSSNNFLTAISVAGVISKAQPAFSNLSGSATAAQMPAFTGDVTSVAGATANTLVNIPLTTTIAGVAGTRGDVLYYGATGWAKLAAGTSGNQLTTNGAGADPTWAAAGSGGSGSPGGSTTQVQFNDAGAFGGDAGLTYDKATDRLTVAGGLILQASPLGGIFYDGTSGGNITFYNNSYVAAFRSNTDLELVSGAKFSWSSSSTDPYSTAPDTSLARNAAGVVEINNGTAGSYRDLILRTLTLTGAQCTGSEVKFQTVLAGTRTYVTAVPNGAVLNNPSAFRVYGTDAIADGTNYEYMTVASKGTGDTYYRIATGALGTGTVRPISISADGTTTQLVFSTAGPITVGGTDVGFARNAAGVLEINNGTAGTYRDIIARTHNATSGYQINGTATAGDYINSSVSSQTPAAVDVYVVGSSIVVPAGAFAAKGQYRCVFDIVKSAGTGTIVVSLRIGTTGTVASDTARITFTFPAAGTTVADTGNIEVCVNWRTVGSGTSAVVAGFCRAAKNTITAAGLWSTTSAALTIVGTVSGGFDSSAATTMGLSFNGSTAFAGTITTVQATLAQ